MYYLLGENALLLLVIRRATGAFGKRPNVNAVYVECVINKPARRLFFPFLLCNYVHKFNFAFHLKRDTTASFCTPEGRRGKLLCCLLRGHTCKRGVYMHSNMEPPTRTILLTNFTSIAPSLPLALCPNICSARRTYERSQKNYFHHSHANQINCDGRATLNSSRP